MWPVLELKTVFWMESSEAREVLRKSNANSVGTATVDDGVVGWKTIEDSSRILCNLRWSEAETRGYHRINLKAGRRAGDRVLDTVLDVDDPWDFCYCFGDLWAKFVEKVGVRREELDLDRFGRVGEIADHILKDLGELNVESRLCLFDLSANIGDDIVNGTRAFGLKTDGEVAVIRLSDSGKGPSGGLSGEEVISTSGVSCRICSTWRRMRFVSVSEVPAGVR